MRIALLTDEKTANTIYRSTGPLLGLMERGHQARELRLDAMSTWNDIVRWCDLLHIHRVCDGGVVALARAAKAAGAAVVWDDDDDLARAPRGTLAHARVGGLSGVQMLAARAKLFEAVDLVTTPSAVLAESFRQGGAREVRVIENYIVDHYVRDEYVRARTGRPGVCIGWVAGSEHRVDAERLKVAGVLERLLEAHPEARVMTIGVRLGIAGDRYTGAPGVRLPGLLEQVAQFDIGIAPLSSDFAMNHSRSSVKLKEYAAVEVPWLASPIGPYAALGEREGGRLVDDDRWFDELDALLRAPRARRKLAKRARRWGRTQTLRQNVVQWERAFEQVLDRARAAA